jgi:hypothetical protein
MASFPVEFESRITMVRPNRHLPRVSFLLVILMILFGAWFGFNNLQPSFALSEIPSGMGNERTDWLEFAASFAEQALQLFLGLASGE